MRSSIILFALVVASNGACKKNAKTEPAAGSASGAGSGSAPPPVAGSGSAGSATPTAADQPAGVGASGASAAAAPESVGPAIVLGTETTAELAGGETRRFPWKVDAGTYDIELFTKNPAKANCGYTEFTFKLVDKDGALTGNEISAYAEDKTNWTKHAEPWELTAGDYTLVLAMNCGGPYRIRISKQ